MARKVALAALLLCGTTALASANPGPAAFQVDGDVAGTRVWQRGDTAMTGGSWTRSLLGAASGGFGPASYRYEGGAAAPSWQSGAHTAASWTRSLLAGGGSSGPASYRFEANAAGAGARNDDGTLVSTASRSLLQRWRQDMSANWGSTGRSWQTQSPGRNWQAQSPGRNWQGRRLLAEAAAASRSLLQRWRQDMSANWGSTGRSWQTQSPGRNWQAQSPGRNWQGRRLLDVQFGPGSWMAEGAGSSTRSWQSGVNANRAWQAGNWGSNGWN